MINPLLRTFVTVAEAGSFSKAADTLFLSSTAIMKQMNQLEEHIGISLLRRTNHGVVLTEAGKSLYEDTKFMLQYSAQAIGRAYSRQLTDNYTIRLGSSLLYPAREFVRLWNRVSSTYPQFKLRIVPFDDTEKNAALLGIGKTMDIVAGAFGRSNTEGFQFIQLNEYHFAIAMPLSHPLAEKQSLRYEDLHGEHLMIMPRGNSLSNDKIREDLEKGHPQIVLEDAPAHYDVDTFNLCGEKGYLLLTLDGWKDLHPSLVTVPLAVNYALPYGIIASDRPNEATRMFLHLVKQIDTL